MPHDAALVPLQGTLHCDQAAHIGTLVQWESSCRAISNQPQGAAHLQVRLALCGYLWSACHKARLGCNCSCRWLSFCCSGDTRSRSGEETLASRGEAISCTPGMLLNNTSSVGVRRRLLLQVPLLSGTLLSSTSSVGGSCHATQVLQEVQSV